MKCYLENMDKPRYRTYDVPNNKKKRTWTGTLLLVVAFCSNSSSCVNFNFFSSAFTTTIIPIRRRDWLSKQKWAFVKYGTCIRRIKKNNDSIHEDSNDEAEREFYEDYLKYTEKCVSDRLKSACDNMDMIRDRNFSSWRLIDWQMRCGSRYKTHRTSVSLGNFDVDNDNSSGKNKEKKKEKRWLPWHKNFLNLSKERTPCTALCIVPCEKSEAWESIQRYRYACRDTRLYFHPPSINLFYPFSPHDSLFSAASATGNLLQLMPSTNASRFEVKLDRVVFLVQRESVQIQQDEELREEMDSSINSWTRKEMEIFDLIKSEEMKGMERKIKRFQKEKKMAKEMGKEFSEDQDAVLNEMISQMEIGKVYIEDDEKETDEVVEIDAFTVTESNKNLLLSPCLLCLAPDIESASRIRSLRSSLSEEIFGSFDRPSGIFRDGCILDMNLKLDEGIPSNNEKSGKMQQEPLVVLGQFQALAKTAPLANAISDELAKTGSIIFNAEDLHFISNDPDGMSNREKKRKRRKPSARFPFGVDAKVRLIDVEEEEDLTSLELEGNDGHQVDLNFEEIFKSLLDVAEVEAKKALMIWSREERESLGIDDELQLDFLNESVEDWNEGATITIGRTQFFLGEKRDYVGMPAYNPLDFKKTGGDDFISGATRRRGARHGALRWNDGDFGRKDIDEA
eukprot:CAMPEP_0116052682 /NCGR_PEP_ID=MMETSP0322-20121206/1712_1 /TAXON_ID=163516 /ORGANISM="Leptocylindrus danicus var. apora, Strain B651" /LENGTH=679 /DNA_ID=CAMNT_0003535651 /DNA_START=176 /DNA_END=2215 /DNA_ORIENTATION=-